MMEVVESGDDWFVNGHMSKAEPAVEDVREEPRSAGHLSGTAHVHFTDVVQPRKRTDMELPGCALVRQVRGSLRGEEYYADALAA
ncbi:MAG: hypothetical protein MZV63_06865 [Marinilabiliales bacterium]|nr:hypothetical protein [Marinilabiliales bacterium]